MPSLIFVLCMICVNLSFLCSAEDVKVTIKNGVLKGSRIKAPNDKSVDVYKGIPYGKPVSGYRKFRYPEPVDDWMSEKDATNYGQQCNQAKPTNFDANNEGSLLWYSESEIGDDCLNLNVWSPVTNNNSKKLPVMVWIFGGGYFSGSGSLKIYDGTFLAAYEEVVVVTMNYRVGLEGFLYNGTSEAPGNQGLMDQLLSLKWVNTNIEKFRGDPNRVTLFGESAGAVSVSLHLISKLSQPYFNRVITESASFYSLWGVSDKTEVKERSKMFPKIYSRNNERFDAVRGVANNYVTDLDYILDVFSPPVADGYFIPADNVDELINKKLVDLLPKDKNIDVLLGTNKDEGTFFMFYAFNIANANGTVSDPTFFSKVNTYPMIFKTIHEKHFAQKYIDKIADTYGIKGNHPREKVNWLDSWNRIQNCFGDSFFKCPVIQLADNLVKANRGSVYMYSFEQQTKSLPFPNWAGVQHGYEIDYVFGMPYSTEFTSKYYTYNEEEKQLSREMMKMWANFAKFGNPSTETSKWPHYDSIDRQFISLKAPLSSITVTKGGVRKKYCDMWNLVLPNMYYKDSKDLLNTSYCLKANFMTILFVVITTMSKIILAKSMM